MSKLEFEFGALSFAGEGDEKWLSQQLDKILQALPTLNKITPPAMASVAKHEAPVPPAGEFKEPLGKYIKSKGGESKLLKHFCQLDL